MNRIALPILVAFMAAVMPPGATAEPVYLPPAEASADDIEIVVGEDRTIFEYRTNGILMMIKVVPEKGKPYYMVPADGSPHFESLDHSKKLYPKWVLLEW